MKVIHVRNVHQALPQALRLIDEEGVRRGSRNGAVRLIEPGPVVTVYERPWERVIFWPVRDANPALHLYESLWMLAGRQDLEPLLRYTKQFAEYSDDGQILQGAYGYRWRRTFGQDQLRVIIRRLTNYPNDRRCVLQVWDSDYDLDRETKDAPCNVTATFQRRSNGQLDMTVLCRSNDLVWGAYGANAVHWSMLLSYMAHEIGCTEGRYVQVSVNWHIYEEWYQKLLDMPRSSSVQSDDGLRSIDPYSLELVQPTIFNNIVVRADHVYSNSNVPIDEWIGRILEDADGFPGVNFVDAPLWVRVYRDVLRAHRDWRMYDSSVRFTRPLATLQPYLGTDWGLAMSEWLQRRYDKWRWRNED